MSVVREVLGGPLDTSRSERIEFESSTDDKKSEQRLCPEEVPFIPSANPSYIGMGVSVWGPFIEHLNLHPGRQALGRQWAFPSRSAVHVCRAEIKRIKDGGGGGSFFFRAD